MQRLHIIGNGKQITRVWAVLVGVWALFCAVGLIVTVAYFAAHHHGSAPTCTTTAAKQLPKSLVDNVNAIEADRNIATPTSDASVTILKERPLSGGGTAQAFVNFFPGYCGFLGNIGDFGIPDTNISDPQDRVILLRHGQQLQADPGGVCVSNTVPTVRTTDNGVIVMTRSCDRLYPNSTWMKTSPALKQLP